MNLKILLILASAAIMQPTYASTVADVQNTQWRLLQKNGHSTLSSKNYDWSERYIVNGLAQARRYGAKRSDSQLRALFADAEKLQNYYKNSGNQRGSELVAQWQIAAAESIYGQQSDQAKRGRSALSATYADVLKSNARANSMFNETVGGLSVGIPSLASAIEPKGNGLTENASSAYASSGKQSSGKQSSGNQSAGNQTSGSATFGNETSGSASAGGTANLDSGTGSRHRHGHNHDGDRERLRRAAEYLKQSMDNCADELGKLNALSQNPGQ